LGSIENLVVLLSGIVEIAWSLTTLEKATSEFWMGLSHILYPSFPGNLAQYLDEKMLWSFKF
jgi:uncharacterized membrane protein